MLACPASWALLTAEPVRRHVGNPLSLCRSSSRCWDGFPYDVQEADQLPIVSRADPSEAVAVKLRLPVGPGPRVALEALTVQCLDLSVSAKAARHS